MSDVDNPTSFVQHFTQQWKDLPEEKRKEALQAFSHVLSAVLATVIGRLMLRRLFLTLHELGLSVPPLTPKQASRLWTSSVMLVGLLARRAAMSAMYGTIMVKKAQKK